MTPVVEVPSEACTPAVLERLRAILHAHEGYEPVEIAWLSSQGITSLHLGALFAVAVSPDLKRELATELGFFAWERA